MARAQRLVKGYGETFERGWRNFATLMAQLDALASRPDGAALLARLHEAALSDEDGTALQQELAALARLAGWPGDKQSAAAAPAAQECVAAERRA